MPGRYGTKMSRRRAVTVIGGSAAALFITGPPHRARAEKLTLLQRPIPASGEKLPVIGLGSWQVFDAGSGPHQRQPLEEVLSRFAALIGRVVGSSPMYGRAGKGLREFPAEFRFRDGPFLGTQGRATRQ